MDDDLKAAVERVEGFCGATENGGVAEWGLYDPVPDLRALLSALRQRDEALRRAVASLEELAAAWPEDSVPSAPVCVRMAEAINNGKAILTGSETNAR